MSSNEQLILLQKEFEILKNQQSLLEIEADAIYSELTSPGLNGESPAGINDPLVDKDDFPRGDIDMFNVKRKRQRLRVINTDHKEIMKRIEEILPGIYTFMSELHPTIQTSTPKVGGAVTNDSVIQRPIAKLDEILPGSPAAEGGVQEGDMLLSFGTVNANIPSPLNGIPEVVRQNVNQPINLVVLRRGTEIVTLQMTPKTWAGRGLLGCHLTPI